jgi:hypothetical protein
LLVVLELPERSQPHAPALSALKCTPHEAIGYGLSKEDADRIDQGANA